MHGRITQSGVIINHTSGCVLVAGDKTVGYCASKGRVVLLTKGMASITVGKTFP